MQRIYFIVKISAMKHPDLRAIPKLRCYKSFHNWFLFFKTHGKRLFLSVHFLLTVKNLTAKRNNCKPCITVAKHFLCQLVNILIMQANEIIISQWRHHFYSFNPPTCMWWVYFDKIIFIEKFKEKFFIF